MDRYYKAEMFGSSWFQGPICHFDTLDDAKAWARSFGNTAVSCAITDNNGEEVAVVARDPNGDGMTWFEAEGVV